MKTIRKIAAVLIYVFLLSVLLHFQFWKLIDLKQMLVLLIGTLLLYLPGNIHNHIREISYQNLSYSGLLAALIQTFVQLFILLSAEPLEETFMEEVALNCRPLLYGICIWGICQTLEEKDAGKNLQKTPEIEKFSATEVYHSFLELGLSKREAEVAVQVARGLSNKEIAIELYISEATVKKHLTNIFQKLGIEGREEIKKRI